MKHSNISKTEFEAKTLDILAQIETSGDSVLVTDNGRPVIEIRKFPSYSDKPLDRLHGSVLEYKGPFDPVADDG